MAGEAWHYVVPFQPDVNRALQDLRRREFEAGRYNPVKPFPEFPVDLEKPGPGAQHATIEEAVEASDMDGTRSILDMEQVGPDPEPGTVTELPAELAEELFGTEHPTAAMLEDVLAVLGQLADRGQGIYVVLYRGDSPSEILFAGWSWD
jgi:hypothetical protein